MNAENKRQILRGMKMENRFFKNNELQDIEIINALKEAVYDYQDGAIAEVRDVLVDIINAIYEWEDNYEV